MAAREEPSRSVYTFDDVEVDRENFRVLKSSQPRTLEPRVFDLLIYLIENRGRVLEKQELFEQVWKQAFVTDNALTRAVKEIRRALGDDASAPRYIETIPKRGYRFIAEIRASKEIEPAAPQASARRAEDIVTTLNYNITPYVSPQRHTLAAILKSAVLGGSRQQRIAFAVIAIAITVAAVWLIWRNANLRWARAQMPRIEQLAQAQKYFEAYDLAAQVTKYLPDEPTLARLLPVISDTLNATTEPAGASVYLKRFLPDESSRFPQRELLGTTPISNLRIARGDYIIYIEKEGYAPVAKPISVTLSRFGSALLLASYTMSRMVDGVVPIDEPSAIKQELIEADQVPLRMVYVPGGKYRMISWGRPTDAKVQLDDYFIDKYEVTNREYKEFIAAGGYQKKRYWKYPFIKDGREISWEEAMPQFKDRTGLAGPRHWTGQNFAEGRAEYPVTDITWYEAAAYAEFRGKQLPTIFQWEKAARDGIFSHYSATIMPWGPVEPGGTVEHRANFKSSGPVPVDRFEFGMSPYGCYNMAGNVSEWCLNQMNEGHATAGGSWDDLSYLFNWTGAFPNFHNSNRIGFRCVVNAPLPTGDQGAMRIDTAGNVPDYTPTSEASFNAWLSHYRYDPVPLDAQILEVAETDDWRREKIAYAGAGGERAIAHLYLPKRFQKPFELIQFVPAGDVYGGYIPIEESVEMILPPFIRSGRAVFAVVFKGFKERERAPDYVSPPATTVRFRDEIVGHAIDLSRGLDYLATRDDIDSSRIAYFGYSEGAEEGLVYTAVESRYKSVVLVAGGLPHSRARWIAEASPMSFASHIRAPKLMLSSRYDEAYPFKTDIEPLFKLLRDPKRLVVYEAGHTPPIETAVPVVNKWLDETLGPVRPD
ncbi:MAG: eukaryotic-like serine/threonine-protein kinase [Blastocatellia bacterium]